MCISLPHRARDPRGSQCVPQGSASTVLHNPTADHELNERMISESHLDWIIARPLRLTNGAPTGKYRSGDDLRSNGFIRTIPRADLADFILKQVEEDTQKADMRLPRA
ncbi:MAG TPA: NAD(P)H-binding protein [Acidobacteriaceae bacterium]